MERINGSHCTPNQLEFLLIREKTEVNFPKYREKKIYPIIEFFGYRMIVIHCPSTIRVYFRPRNKFCCRLTARNRGTTGEKRSTPIKVSKWKTDSVIGARSKSWIIHFRCMHKHDSFPMRTIAGRKKFFEQKPLR